MISMLALAPALRTIAGMVSPWLTPATILRKHSLTSKNWSDYLTISRRNNFLSTLAALPVVGMIKSNDLPGQPLARTELIFEVEGCRVYRFIDSGMHYLAKCDNGVVALSK